MCAVTSTEAGSFPPGRSAHTRPATRSPLPALAGSGTDDPASSLPPFLPVSGKLLVESQRAAASPGADRLGITQWMKAARRTQARAGEADQGAPCSWRRGCLAAGSARGRVPAPAATGSAEVTDRRGGGDS